MNKKINWKNYISTSLFTLVVLFLCSSCYLWYDTVIGYDINFKQESEVPQDLVMYTIDELKKDSKYYDNARICYEIGTLYERIFLFDKAIKYYLRSIELASKNYFLPHFKLATLYMELERFDDAVAVMSIIPNINNKNLKMQKGDFWHDLSVRCANQNKIDMAIDANKKAIFYYNRVDKDAYKEARNEQIFLFMKKSEQLIEGGELREGIALLENMHKINDSAELTYRLAILNYKNNNEKAFKYFEQVQAKNPSIINYDIYYDLINELYEDAKQKKEVSKEIFYKQKAELLKKYVNNNFISENEFVLDNVSASLSNEFWGLKKKVEINFDVYNNTKYSFRNLYVQVDMNIGDTEYVENMKIKNNKNLFLPYTTVKNIKINLDISKEVKSVKNLKGKIYLYKNPKFNKIELGTIEL